MFFAVIRTSDRLFLHRQAEASIDSEMQAFIVDHVRFKRLLESFIFSISQKPFIVRDLPYHPWPGFPVNCLPKPFGPFCLLIYSYLIITVYFKLFIKFMFF